MKPLFLPKIIGTPSVSPGSLCQRHPSTVVTVCETEKHRKKEKKTEKKRKKKKNTTIKGIIDYLL